MAPVDLEKVTLWDADIKTRVETPVQTATKQIDDNLPVILNSTEGAVMGLPGYQNAIDRAKGDVGSGIETVQRSVNEVKELNRLATEQIEFLRRKIERNKEEVARLKVEEKESVEITALRKEQAAELKTKYASNLHTSWLGLWKPMSGDSYTGILVASVVFGLIALLSLFLLVTRPFRPIIPVEGRDFRDFRDVRVVGGALQKIARIL